MILASHGRSGVILRSAREVGLSVGFQLLRRAGCRPPPRRCSWQKNPWVKKNRYITQGLPRRAGVLRHPFMGSWQTNANKSRQKPENRRRPPHEISEAIYRPLSSLRRIRSCLDSPRLGRRKNSALCDGQELLAGPERNRQRSFQMLIRYSQETRPTASVKSAGRALASCIPFNFSSRSASIALLETSPAALARAGCKDRHRRKRLFRILAGNGYSYTSPSFLMTNPSSAIQ